VFCGGVCIQDMVVRVWSLTDPVSGERVRERCGGVYFGTVFVAVPYHSDFSGMRSVPSDLPSPNPPTARLRGILPRGLRRGVGDVGTP